MSTITLDKTLCHLPAVTRGYGYPLSANGKKGDRMIYTNQKSVFIRNMEDETEATVFAGEHMADTSVAKFSPNGEWVASGDIHGNVIIWGQGNQSVKGNYPVNKGVADISWDADGKRIVAVGAGEGNQCRCFSWDTGNAIGTVGGHTKNVLSVDYRQERPFAIITAGEDHISCVNKGPPFKFDKSIKDHSNYVNKIAYSPDSSKFCTVSSDQKIIIYEAVEAVQIKVLESKADGHKGSIYSFAWSPDGTKVLTCSADKTAKVWNIESGAVETTFTFNAKPTVNDMQMSAVWHKDYMMTVSLSGALNYLDPANPATPKKVICGHVAPIQDMCNEPGSTKFFTADSAGCVSAWVDFKATWFTGKGHGKSITAIALSNDKSKLVTVGLDDKLRINDCASQEFNNDYISLGGAPYCVTCAHSSDTIVAGTAKNVLVVVKGGSWSKEVPVASKPLCIAYSPSDDKIAVGLEKGGMQVFDADWKLLYTLESSMAKKVIKVVWSPDGKTLLMSGAAKSILVFQGEKQMNPTDWEFHTGGVTDTVFSPDGSKVASVSSDLSVIVWEDTATWKTKRATKKMAHREGLIKCAFLDDNTLVTVGLDACMKVWKV